MSSLKWTDGLLISMGFDGWQDIGRDPHEDCGFPVWTEAAARGGDVWIVVR